MRLNNIVAAGSALALLAACAQPGDQRQGSLDKQTVGTVAGAIAGGVIGSKFGKGSGKGIAIGVGTLLGAALGNEVGASLDRADMAYYRNTSQQALETAPPGQTLPWSNPQSGNHGTVTPQAYYQTASGQYCREYTQTISVGGKQAQGYGTACRQPDGSWQIIE